MPENWTQSNVAEHGFHSDCSRGDEGRGNFMDEFVL